MRSSLDLSTADALEPLRHHGAKISHAWSIEHACARTCSRRVERNGRAAVPPVLSRLVLALCRRERALASCAPRRDTRHSAFVHGVRRSSTPTDCQAFLQSAARTSRPGAHPVTRRRTILIAPAALFLAIALAALTMPACVASAEASCSSSCKAAYGLLQEEPGSLEVPGPAAALPRELHQEQALSRPDRLSPAPGSRTAGAARARPSPAGRRCRRCARAPRRN